MANTWVRLAKRLGIRECMGKYSKSGTFKLVEKYDEGILYMMVTYSFLYFRFLRRIGMFA
ncbi:hypothetical protein [Clostridium sp.]|uniref:hypothetical protein n=1 Tax=Clostridium sp. TaxID=1506 RepID=UPI0025B84ABC|nr:hypothetical protein [Clostridium sp.]